MEMGAVGKTAYYKISLPIYPSPFSLNCFFLTIAKGHFPKISFRKMPLQVQVLECISTTINVH